MSKNALILSCGGSPEPLIFCIKEHEHDFIYFLCSNDSVNIAKDITSKLNIGNEQFNIKVVSNHESLDESFAKSREIIKELQKDYENIHVDFSGGTKPMVSGLVLAAIGENCSYTYVGLKEGHQRDKNGVGIVPNGFEKIKEQKDPYDVYAVMEFEKGKEFFDKYQFESAKTNFIEASKKLESEDLCKLAKIYIQLVKIYDKWDKFDNLLDKKTLKGRLSSILTENSQILRENLSDGFISQIENNVEFLKLKISKRGKIKTKNVCYYLPDLLNNSLRRIEEGKYDDAVARLYRTIELIAQVQLTKENIIEEHILESNRQFSINRIKLNNSPNLKNNPEKLLDIFEYVEAEKSEDKIFKIGLTSSYQVLDCLDSELAKEYLNDKKLRDKISLRNSSILAHGLEAIDKETAETLYSEIFKYAQKALPEIKKYMEMSRFPKFSD